MKRKIGLIAVLAVIIGVFMGVEASAIGMGDVISVFGRIEGSEVYIDDGGGSSSGSSGDTGSVDSNTDICKSYKEQMQQKGQYQKYKELYATYCGGDKDEDDAKDLVKSILSSVFMWMGIVAVIVIIIGGVFYMTSEGDPGKVAKAKNTILYAVIGLIVALLSFALVNFVLKGMSE